MVAAILSSRHGERAAAIGFGLLAVLATVFLVFPALAGITIRPDRAKVIDFFAARHRIRKKRAAQWLRTYTRPMPPEAA